MANTTTNTNATNTNTAPTARKSLRVPTGSITDDDDYTASTTPTAMATHSRARYDTDIDPPRDSFVTFSDGATLSPSRARSHKSKTMKTKNRKINKKHPEFELTYDMMLGIRTVVGQSEGRNRGKELREDDLYATIKLNFPGNGSVRTPAHQMRDFKFKDYSPEVFRCIRERFGLNPADYLTTVCGNFQYLEFISNSKSGQFFFYTYDRKFMIKTVSKEESKFLRAMLPSYYAHVRKNPETLLTRFYGMHRVKPHKKNQVHFLVMASVFDTPRYIHQTFDLKGSKQGRNATPMEKRRANCVYKDNDFTEMKIKLRIGAERKKRLITQLMKDVEYLKSLAIMDYSLLLGIHFTDRPDPTKLGSIAPSTVSYNGDDSRQMMQPGEDWKDFDFYGPAKTPTVGPILAAVNPPLASATTATVTNSVPTPAVPSSNGPSASTSGSTSAIASATASGSASASSTAASTSTSNSATTESQPPRRPTHAYASASLPSATFDKLLALTAPPTFHLPSPSPTALSHTSANANRPPVPSSNPSANPNPNPSYPPTSRSPVPSPPEDGTAQHLPLKVDLRFSLNGVAMSAATPATTPAHAQPSVMSAESTRTPPGSIRLPTNRPDRSATLSPSNFMNSVSKRQSNYGLPKNWNVVSKPSDIAFHAPAFETMQPATGRTAATLDDKKKMSDVAVPPPATGAATTPPLVKQRSGDDRRAVPLTPNATANGTAHASANGPDAASPNANGADSTTPKSKVVVRPPPLPLPSQSRPSALLPTNSNRSVTPAYTPSVAAANNSPTNASVSTPHATSATPSLPNTASTPTGASESSSASSSNSSTASFSSSLSSLTLHSNGPTAFQLNSTEISTSTTALFNSSYEGGGMWSAAPAHECYYMGIIDILTIYTARKRMENFAKGFKYNRRDISAVPPAEYAKRFLDFLEKSFV